MVDDSPTPRPHSSLPMAPRLQRSARLRNVLRSQPRVKQPASRAARSMRRRMKGNFFAFVAAQVLIAVVAFIVVTDYIADGPIRHEVSNILSQVADAGRDAKSDQDAVIVVEPPTALDEAPTRRRRPFTKSPRRPNRWKHHPPKSRSRLQPSNLRHRSQKPACQLSRAASQLSRQPLNLCREPKRRQPLNLRRRPQKPVVAVEPAPPAEEPPAAPLVQPQTAEKAGEDVVALAPIPDLTPQADAPAAAPPRRIRKTKAGRWADDPRLRHVP